MEKLKIAFKCTTCKRDCKQLIISGDIQYCPKYTSNKSNKSVKIYENEMKVVCKW